MKRNKHSLSHYVLSTFDMGKLVPIGNFEVLPGDSVRMATSCLLRVSPLMAPVMHPVNVRIHHWFVPYRILWPDWEDFITGGSDGQGDGAIYPENNAYTPLAGSLGDYLGIPPGVASDVGLLPFYAYNAVWNEHYRDQDLQAEVALDNTDILPVAWEKDYLTSARPWTQKGPEVTLPLGTTAPVIPNSSLANTPTFQNQATTQPYGQLNNANAGVEGVGVTTGQGTLSTLRWHTTGLLADLSGATGASINDVRRAFAIQRYQEARAQYGSRYTEYLRYLGVRSSDARLQRPEYLGGGRATISFSEVLRTGNSDGAIDDAPIGEMRGHGISAMRSRRFIRFFEEHGVVLSLASIRPRTMYTESLHRSWSRRTKEDYWQRELEQIGQQAVLNSEVFAGGAGASNTFGYQNRYDEYRHRSSYVTGDFRSTMNDWHLARSFSSAPTLNADFIECDPSKRIHADQTSNTIWGMFSHSIQMRRMVGHKTIGRLF